MDIETKLKGYLQEQIIAMEEVMNEIEEDGDDDYPQWVQLFCENLLVKIEEWKGDC